MIDYEAIPRDLRCFTDGLTLDQVDGLQRRYARVESITVCGVDSYVIELDLGGRFARHPVDKEALEEKGTTSIKSSKGTKSITRIKTARKVVERKRSTGKNARKESVKSVKKPV